MKKIHAKAQIGVFHIEHLANYTRSTGLLFASEVGSDYRTRGGDAGDIARPAVHRSAPAESWGRAVLRRKPARMGAADL